ncbi:hypothetical protein BT93_G1722 [Corymbia citriodora subsp. variegata]|nr:hypothetical protein BT93_G1722 [Corymbia citriodora subsp. variegata]
MSRELDSPVQTQMAVALFKTPISREYHGTNRNEGKPFKSPLNGENEGKQPTGRRRVFVQTETGCVLGMELDRSDNAHTVKRRLQIALNFPIEESSLTFGDKVLTNDLSAVLNDSPLLLTRNFLHRSSSTPCLSPTGRDTQQRDKSGPIEILGRSDQCERIKQLVKDVVKAINTGVDPIPVHGGLGGAYYFRNSRGDCVAIIKPTDEEPFAPNNPKGFVGKALGQPGLKRSVRVGETGIREVAAYLLDSKHYANVPPTALVKITHHIFNINDGVNPDKPNKKKVSKIASFQEFIPHDFDASDHGTSSFPVSVVHRIGILDVRIFNTDRHAGNLLVRKFDSMGRFGQADLIPIDHGLCLPETLEDPYFEWIHWPQASIPFSEDELKAAAYGLCLAEIGEMMSREFRNGEEEPSELEVVCIEARRSIADRDLLSPKSYPGDDEFQFVIDCEDIETGIMPKMTMDDYMYREPFDFGIGSNGRNPLSRLEEGSDEEEESEDEEEKKRDGVAGVEAFEKIPSVSKLSMSLKNTVLSKKSLKQPKNSGMMQENGFMANTSSGHRSANEQLPASVSFVNLADMCEVEWPLFLERFQELLHPAFDNRKSAISGQRQRLRLGTSCQF